MLEQDANRLAVVDTTNGLGKDGGNVNDLELGAEAAVLRLGHRVGDEYLVNGRGVDAGNGIAAENTVGKQGVDLEGALALEKLGSAGNGVGRVAEIVHQDADAVSDVTDEHHAGVALLGKLDRAAFLESVSFHLR